MNQSINDIILPALNTSSERRDDGPPRYDELLIYNKQPHRHRRRRESVNKNRKVFVVSRGVHDFSAAEKFGELHYLSDEIQLRLSTPAVVRRFTDILTNESSPSDLILCTGLAFLNGIACTVFDQLHGKVNMLVYNKALNSYTEHVLDLPDSFKSAVASRNDVKAASVV